MADISNIQVQELVEGTGDWTNIQEVLRLAVVDIIKVLANTSERVKSVHLAVEGKAEKKTIAQLLTALERREAQKEAARLDDLRAERERERLHAEELARERARGQAAHRQHEADKGKEKAREQAMLSLVDQRVASLVDQKVASLVDQRVASLVNQKVANLMDQKVASLMDQTREQLQQELTSLSKRAHSLEVAVDNKADPEQLADLKDQLLLFIHTKTHELYQKSVSSIESYGDVKEDLQRLPSKSDFEDVVQHLKVVQSRHKKVNQDFDVLNRRVDSVEEKLAVKPDKVNYDTLTKRFLILDRKINVLNNRCEKNNAAADALGTKLEELTGGRTLDALEDFTQMLAGTKQEWSDKHARAVGRLDKAESALAGKASRADLDVFVKDLTQLGSTTKEWLEKFEVKAETIKELVKCLEDRPHRSELALLEEKIADFMNARMEEIAGSAQDAVAHIKRLHGNLSGKNDLKKVSKQMSNLELKFKDWSELVRQAHSRVTEVEAKVNEGPNKGDYHSLKRVLSVANTKIRTWTEEMAAIKGRIKEGEAKVERLPGRKELQDFIHRNVMNEVDSKASRWAIEASEIKSNVGRIEASLLQYASLDNLSKWKGELMNNLETKANSMRNEIQNSFQRINTIESQVIQLAPKDRMHRVEQQISSLSGSLTKELSKCSEDTRDKLKAVHKLLSGKAEKGEVVSLANDVNSLDLKASEQRSELQGSVERVQSKLGAIDSMIQDIDQKAKKLQMESMEKPDKHDVKLLVLSEFNTRAKGLENDNRLAMKKASDLQAKLDQYPSPSALEENWRGRFQNLRLDVEKACVEVGNKSQMLIQNLKGETMSSVSSVLDTVQKIQKDTDESISKVQQLFSQEIGDRYETLVDQYRSYAASVAENEKAITESISKLEGKSKQFSEKQSSLKETMQRNLSAQHSIDSKLDAFISHSSAQISEVSKNASAFEQELDSKIHAIHNKINTTGRNLLEAVEGRTSAFITKSELEKAVDDLRKLVSLKLSRMQLSPDPSPSRSLGDVAETPVYRSVKTTPSPGANSANDDYNVAARGVNGHQSLLEQNIPSEVSEVMKSWGSLPPHTRREGPNRLVSMMDDSSQRLLQIRTSSNKQ